MRQIIAPIQHAISGDRIYGRIREINNYHRIQASTGYRAAAEHVVKRLTDDGLDVTLKSYPANPETWYLTWKMFREWDCRAASLNLVAPERCLADFQTDNQSIIQRSYPCDYRNQPLDIVLLDKGKNAEAYADLDLTGKLVFVRDHFQAFMWAIKDKGAVGFVTDYLRPLEGIRTRYDLYDTYNYTSFWWKHDADEPQTFGFVLTPRHGDELAQICREQRAKHEADSSHDRYPKATCYVDSSLYDGAIEVVETMLQGETNEEVLITSHLCHPRSSANDNASGVATSMEVVKVIKDLIDQGKLPKPKRTIRMIFMPEFTGTFAYLHAMDTSNIKAGINMDMVGARQSNLYGPITVSGVSHANPSCCDDVAALVLDEVTKNAGAIDVGDAVPMFNAIQAGFSGGSDHVILTDPTINIPAPMLGQWPDKTYHTSSDTMDVIDPYILHKSATICASYIYTLANLDVAHVPLILNKNRARFVAELSRIVNKALEESPDPRCIYEQFEHVTCVYQACVATLPTWFDQPNHTGIQQQVSHAQTALETLAETMWMSYRNHAAPDFTYEADNVPQHYLYVPVRRYKAPIINLDSYTVGEPTKHAAHEAFKQHHSHAQGVHTLDLVIQFNIDGKRSLWDIAQAAMLETGEGNVEYVHAYVDLLRQFGLVEVLGDRRVPARG